MKIVICSSGNFYKELFPIKEELEKMGHEVVVPRTAHTMKETGNFNIADYKTWYDNPSHFSKKTDYMNWHLEEIKKGDVVLVVNLEKNGVGGYIGGNVLLEIFYAWLDKKPIYILNDVPKELPLYEEVFGMNPVILDGDLSKIRPN